MKTKNKSGKRNTALFYALLKQQPGYHSQYKGLIKENLIRNFTRANGIRLTHRLTDLTEDQYHQLIQEMKQEAVNHLNAKEHLNKLIRQDHIAKIFRKLSELGVTTINGYQEINFHIKRLKGFGGKIIPELKTEELPEVFKAVCNYVDYYKKIIEQENKLASLN